MATLSKREATRERASKHARRSHLCPLCGAKSRGNGGWSSHKRAHRRRGEGPERWDARSGS